MWNSGVNTGFAKCFIFFMAAVILTQGGAYLALSIGGIIFGQCSSSTSDITDQPLKFVLNLVYFLKEECGSPTVTVPIRNESVVLNVFWNETYKITQRTYIFLITYAVVSSLWIVTSFFVIATLCIPITKAVVMFSFGPWFVSIIIGSIVDVVSTSYYALDIIQTVDAEKTFNYVGVSTNNADVMAFLKNFDPYFITPSVMMTCISCRLILIWLLNIIGSCFCLSLSRVLCQRNASSAKSSVHSVDTASTAPLAQTISNKRRHEGEQQGDNGSPMVKKQQQPSDLIQPKSLQLQNVTSVSRQPSLKSQHRTANVEQPTTYRSSDTHHNKLDYNTIHQQLSPITPLNTRYVAEGGEHYHNHSHHHSMYVSEELRSQLPWSYINMRPQTSLSLPTTYPEIPVPDYEKTTE